jgi:NAD(P)-dependent dehydrogenase (short-subunit alcohol dehydrogenase family)
VGSTSSLRIFVIDPTSLHAGTISVHQHPPACPLLPSHHRRFHHPNPFPITMSKIFRPSARALITGGSSGIGLAVARLCLAHEMRVTIADANAETLDLAKKNHKGDITCLKMDVGERADWKRVKEQVGDVEFLMLNAGVGGQGTWGDEGYFDKILHTNLNGVVNGLNAYVPSFQGASSDKPSAIVITGSKQGITNPPGNPAYNASKAAVKALAEHLSYDLKDTNVGVHLLVPGWTFTGLVCRAARLSLRANETSLATSPAQTSRNPMVRGQVSKLRISWSRRWTRASSTSSARTMMSRRRWTRSVCCGRWGMW